MSLVAVKTLRWHLHDGRERRPGDVYIVSEREAIDLIMRQLVEAIP